MGIIGTNPVVSKRAEYGAAIASVADSTAQTQEGSVVFHVDASNRWSVLKYYKAAATIALGAALVKDTGGRDPNLLITSATGDAGMNVCKGFAAAAVSNTSYFSWAYIAGYCPDAALPTNYASNQPMRLSGTYAGRLSSAAIQATTVNATFNVHTVAWSLGAAAVSTANSTNSIVISGWLL